MAKIFGYLLFGLGWLTSRAFAATTTTTFNVTATVPTSCNVTVATDLDFGMYNPILSTNLDAIGTVDVSCTSGGSYNVGLNAGTGSGATVANRLMTKQGGSDTISYSIYQDSSYTTVWGNTIGTDTVAATGTGTTQQLTVYGRIFSTNPTSIPPGSYLDTVTLTVTY